MDCVVSDAVRRGRRDTLISKGAQRLPDRWTDRPPVPGQRPPKNPPGIWMGSPNRELADDRRCTRGSLNAVGADGCVGLRITRRPLPGGKWQESAKSLSGGGNSNRRLYAPQAVGSRSSHSSCRLQRAHPARITGAMMARRNPLDISRADLRCWPARTIQPHAPTSNQFQESTTCDSHRRTAPGCATLRAGSNFHRGSSTYLSWTRTICARWFRVSVYPAAPTKIKYLPGTSVRLCGVDTSYQA
jgi:hypothetical protein